MMDKNLSETCTVPFQK